jgi:hypothetical protein
MGEWATGRFWAEQRFCCTLALGALFLRFPGPSSPSLERVFALRAAHKAIAVSPFRPLAALAYALAALDTINSAFGLYRLMAADWVLPSGLLGCYEKPKSSSGTKPVPSDRQTPMAAISLDSRANSTRRRRK